MNNTQLFVDDRFRAIFIEVGPKSEIIVRADGIRIDMRFGTRTLEDLQRVTRQAYDQISDNTPDPNRLERDRLNKAAPTLLKALEDLLVNPKDAVARNAGREAVIGASLGFVKPEKKK